MSRSSRAPIGVRVVFEHCEQRVFATAVDALIDLEIAPRCRVEHDVGIRRHVREAVDEFERLTVRRLCESSTPRRPRRAPRQIVAAETAQIARAEVARQRRAREIDIELEAIARAAERESGADRGECWIVGQQNFGRLRCARVRCAMPRRSSTSSTQKRPLARSSHAMPKRPLGAADRRRVGCRRLHRAALLRSTYPGVTMRSTRRSTGPFDVAGSPICSQIATDSPSRTSRAR